MDSIEIVPSLSQSMRRQRLSYCSARLRRFVSSQLARRVGGVISYFARTVTRTRL